MMGQTLPAPAAQGAIVEAAAASFRAWVEAAREGYSERTVEAWLYDLACFERWSAEHPAALGSALPERVAAYLRDMSAAGRAVATLRRQLATLARLSRAGGIPDPTKTEVVQLAMRGIARSRGTSQRQAQGLNEREATLAEGALATSGKTIDVRNLAMVLTGRDLMARANELVSLDLAAVSFQEDGNALVKVRRKKTDTETTTCRLDLEATAALRRWLEAAGITDPAAPLFQGLTKGGNLTGNRLLPGDVGRIVKRVAGKKFSAHSLRVGMAQDMVGAGINGAAIQQAAGWKTPRMLARYTAHLDARQGAVAQYHARRHK